MPRITQLKDILNGTLTATGIVDQVTGEAIVATEDLSNLVDVGKAVLDYTSNNNNKEAFIKSLIDQVGKIMFVDRVYSSQAPSILMDSWEYGTVLEKVRCEVPDTRTNATWDLFNYPYTAPAADDDGNTDYPDPFVLSKPSAKAKFFNSKATYEVPITLTDVQLRSAFQSAEQLSSFIAMIENRIRVKRTLINDALIMATIDNLIAQKVALGHTVNLLALYNAGPNAGGTPLTKAKALTDKEFLRFASKTVAQYTKYLATASTAYNESSASGNPNASGGYVTFTPADRLKFVASTEFAKSLDSYLYSDTYHNEFVNLSGYEEVAFWQGQSDRLKIDVTAAIDDGNDTHAAVVQDGVLAVMFDRDAAAVCNVNDRVTSIWNPRGEYYNYFYKWDAMYLNDILENVVVFVIDDAYVEDLKLQGWGSTAPTNWSTIRAKLFTNVAGVMTAATSASWDADEVYYYKVGDAPADPTKS